MRRRYSFVIAIGAVLLIALPISQASARLNFPYGRSPNQFSGITTTVSSDGSKDSNSNEDTKDVTDSSGSNDSSNDNSSIRDELKTDDTELASDLSNFRSASLENKLKTLKTFGDKASTNRLNALDKLTARINTGFCSTIDPAVKAVLLADIAALRSSLTTTQTKIDDDTDLTTGKADVKDIFSSNRVFAHFIPAVMGVCTSEKIIELVDTKITPLITQLGTAGKDTTQAATDATTAKTSASAALTLYEKVAAAPGASATNNANLQTGNTNLARARSALAAVKADIEKLK